VDQPPLIRRRDADPLCHPDSPLGMPVASVRLEPIHGLILQAQMSTEFADTRFRWSGGCFRERYDAELLMCQLTEMGVMKHSGCSTELMEDNQPMLVLEKNSYGKTPGSCWP